MAVVHLSPELPRLTVRGHKRELTEVPFDFLSASYPSPTDTAAPTQLQRSYSGRPRSQTSEVSVSAAAKTRKSLRHLGRSRVVAGMNSWKGKQAGGSNGSENRRASTSDADEATTEQIDSAFTRIKEQLAKFSEEDQALKERVEKLNEEIHILHAPVQKMKEMRLESQSGQHRVCTITPSWKSPHFSASVYEFDSPAQTSTPRRSVPVLMISSSSRDNLQLDLGDPVHETITEQEEGTGLDGLSDSRHGNGYKETRPINFRLRTDSVPLSANSTNSHNHQH
jgi:hypothetical protein